MIDKILNKIHEEQDGLMDAQGNFAFAEDEGAYHALCDLEAYIDSLVKESASDGLDKAAQKYAKYTAAPPSDVAYHFVAGANWQKQQMMKDAIDAEVEQEYYNPSLPLYIDTIYVDDRADLKRGDKVKLIIINEEGK